MATIALSTVNLKNAIAVSSSYNYGDTVTITITANTGYKFKTAEPPELRYYNTNWDYIREKTTVSGDRKTATYTLDSNKIVLEGTTATIYVSGTAEQSTATMYTVTKNLTNCTTTAPDTIEENTQFNWNIFSNEGYEFKEGSVTSNIGSITFNPNYPNLANIAGTATGNITITATATEIVTHTITKNLSNCTGEIPSTIEDGSQFTWTLTPNEGYEFKEGSVTSTVGTVSITSTGATITGTATGDITIQATATAIPVIVTHTVTKTLTNCTGEIPSTIQDGSQFTWTLTPNEGYEFKEGSVTSNVGIVSITSTGTTITGTATEDITILATATEIVKTVNISTGTVENCSYTPKTATYGDTATITITCDKDYAFTTQTPYIEYTASQGYQEQHNFKLNNDKTTGTVSVDTHDVDATKLEIEVYATATYQQGTTVSEMYTVYSVSPSDLQAVSNKRFVNVSGSDYYIEQLITYINDLYRLPLAFKDLPTQALMLKNETIVNNAHVIPNVVYTYDLGTVTLPKKYNNSNDYNNVYDIMLPYYGVYTLDNAKALDTAIKIQAIIDIITGTCVYVFSRDGHTIDSVKTNVKENLPYMTKDMQQVGSLTTVTQFEVEPSITCYYHDITNAYVNKDVNETVSNLTYFKADNIIHCNGISNKYKNLILNKLREGVFTNEL